MVLNMRNIVDKTILHSSIDNDTRLKNNIFDDYVHFELMGDI